MAKRHYIPITADVPGVNEGQRAFIRKVIRTALHDDEREREARAHDRPALERAALAVHGEAMDERHAHEP